MAKSESSQPAEDTVQVQPDQYPLSLDEFCTRISQTDRRVELIGGFHRYAQLKGLASDTEANFRAQFEQFLKQPAK